MGGLPRILVVDDELGPREALRMILKSKYQVMTATNGPDALQIIRNTPPDLVLLDIKMREMHGIEVLQAIKRLDATIEVIMITAYASVETARNAMAYDAMEYLIKPFGKAEIDKVVSKALARRATKLDSRQEVRLLLEQIRTLSQASTTPASSQEFVHGATVLLQQGMRLLPARAALLHVFVPSTQHLVCPVSLAMPAEYRSRVEDDAWGTFLHTTLTLRQPRLVIPTSLSAQDATMLQTLRACGYAGGVFFPVLAEPETLGVVSFLLATPETLREDYRDIGTMFAELMAFTIRTHQRYQVSQQDAASQAQRIAQLSILREISRAIIGNLELDNVLQSIGNQLQSGLGYAGLYVWLWETDTRQLRQVYGRGPQHGWQPLGRLQDIPQALRVEQDADTQIVLAPLVLQGNPLGIIKLVRHIHQSPLAEFEIEMIRMLLDYIVLVVKNSQLYEEIKYNKDYLENINKEKEILLKEIHHRVKNNLQIISSLLYLQSRGIHDESIIELFEDSQNRIKSIALVHERLYQTQGMARIQLDSYIQELTAHLFHACGAKADTICLRLDIDDISLGLDTAIPCGLILNELVSNALKYAFPTRQEGTIHIAIHRNPEDTLTLTVRDDGIGLPEEIDFRHTESLGLQLVTMLVTQLQGTIALHAQQGTAFVISFRELTYKERLQG